MITGLNKAAASKTQAEGRRVGGMKREAAGQERSGAVELGTPGQDREPEQESRKEQDISVMSSGLRVACATR